MSQDTCIQSGELVIISRGKFLTKISNKVKSLRFYVVLMVLLAGFVPGVCVYGAMIRTYETRAVSLQTAEVKNQCTILSNQLYSYHYLTDRSSEVIDASLTQLTNIYNGRVMIADQNLKVVKDTYSLDEGKINVSENVIRCMRGESTDYYDKKNRYIEVTSPIKDPDTGNIEGVMLASVSTDTIADSCRMLYSRGAAVFGAALLFVLGAAFLIAERIVRPLCSMASEIEGVTDGYVDEVMHVDRFSETNMISMAFNKMLGRFKRLDESKEEFVSNVSHELKTPLASMKVLADSLVTQENVPIELYQEFMEDIAREIDRENEIITDLLTLVKMDKTAQNLNIRQVQINDLMELILKRLKPIAEQKNVEVVLESFRPVTAEVDEVKLSLAISNLVENAIKYNRENGWVHVFLNADHKFFYVKVADSGIGIPKEDQEHIFERFYRVDKSHSREIGGTGLGLAITRNAVIMHRGSIKVHSEHGEGTTFIVRIPLIYISSNGSGV